MSYNNGSGYSNHSGSGHHASGGKRSGGGSHQAYYAGSSGGGHGSSNYYYQQQQQRSKYSNSAMYKHDYSSYAHESTSQTNKGSSGRGGGHRGQYGSSSYSASNQLAESSSQSTRRITFQRREGGEESHSRYPNSSQADYNSYSQGQPEEGTAQEYYEHQRGDEEASHYYYGEEETREERGPTKDGQRTTKTKDGSYPNYGGGRTSTYQGSYSQRRGEQSSTTQQQEYAGSTDQSYYPSENGGSKYAGRNDRKGDRKPHSSYYQQEEQESYPSGNGAGGYDNRAQNEEKNYYEDEKAYKKYGGDEEAYKGGENGYSGNKFHQKRGGYNESSGRGGARGGDYSRSSYKTDRGGRERGGNSNYYASSYENNESSHYNTSDSQSKQKSNQYSSGAQRQTSGGGQYGSRNGESQYQQSREGQNREYNNYEEPPQQQQQYKDEEYNNEEANNAYGNEDPNYYESAEQSRNNHDGYAKKSKRPLETNQRKKDYPRRIEAKPLESISKGGNSSLQFKYQPKRDGYQGESHHDQREYRGSNNSEYPSSNQHKQPEQVIETVQKVPHQSHRTVTIVSKNEQTYPECRDSRTSSSWTSIDGTEDVPLNESSHSNIEFSEKNNPSPLKITMTSSQKNHIKEQLQPAEKKDVPINKVQSAGEVETAKPPSDNIVAAADLKTIKANSKQQTEEDQALKDHLIYSIPDPSLDDLVIKTKQQSKPPQSYKASALEEDALSKQMRELQITQQEPGFKYSAGYSQETSPHQQQQLSYTGQELAGTPGQGNQFRYNLQSQFQANGTPDPYDNHVGWVRPQTRWKPQVQQDDQTNFQAPPLSQLNTSTQPFIPSRMQYSENYFDIQAPQLGHDLLPPQQDEFSTGIIMNPYYDERNQNEYFEENGGFQIHQQQQIRVQNSPPFQGPYGNSDQYFNGYQPEPPMLAEAQLNLHAQEFIPAKKKQQQQLAFIQQRSFSVEASQNMFNYPIDSPYQQTEIPLSSEPYRGLSPHSAALLNQQRGYPSYDPFMGPGGIGPQETMYQQNYNQQFAPYPGSQPQQPFYPTDGRGPHNFSPPRFNDEGSTPQGAFYGGAPYDQHFAQQNTLAGPPSHLGGGGFSYSGFYNNDFSQLQPHSAQFMNSPGGGQRSLAPEQIDFYHSNYMVGPGGGLGGMHFGAENAGYHHFGMNGNNIGQNMRDQDYFEQDHIEHYDRLLNEPDEDNDGYPATTPSLSGSDAAQKGSSNLTLN